MSKRITRHVRANAVGYVALFIALTGTAVAANGPLPGRNTVGSADIINREVKAADLGKGAVRSVKIRNGHVRTPDLADGAVKASKLGEIVTRESAEVEVPANTVGGDGHYRMREATLECPPGTQLISGGARWRNDPGVADEMVIASIKPLAESNRITVTGGHDLEEDRFLIARALCLG